MDDLLNDFLTETAESLAELDVALVRLERTPNHAGTLSLIFRLVHTIKGTCGFLGLPRLERVAHAAENVLGKVRDGVLTVTPEVVTQVLAALDRVKLIVAGLAATEAEPQGDDTALIAALRRTSPPARPRRRPRSRPPSRRRNPPRQSPAPPATPPQPTPPAAAPAPRAPEPLIAHQPPAAPVQVDRPPQNPPTTRAPPRCQPRPRPPRPPTRRPPTRRKPTRRPPTRGPPSRPSASPSTCSKT